MTRRGAAVAAFVVSAAGLISQAPAAAPPRTINIPPEEYPGDVQPGDRPLRVTVRYEIGDEGRFVRCTVRRSSGHASLDAASCRLLWERARFRPEPGMESGTLVLQWMGRQAAGRNPAGSPIPVSLVDVLTSEDYPGEAMVRDEEGAVGYAVEVSETGVPRGCTVTESSGSERLDRRTCEIVMDRSAFIPASNGAGGRARGVYRARITWRID